MYYIVHSATHNPRTSLVDLRTTRSLLTASERSTAIGITTGIIGTTGEREGGSKMQFVVKFPREALARVVIFSLQAHIPPLLASSPGPHPASRHLQYA